MKYCITTDGKVHLVNALNSEFTLCGDAWDIDQTEDRIDGAGHGHKPHPRGPVTCQRCANVILACRGIRISNTLQNLKAKDRPDVCVWKKEGARYWQECAGRYARPALSKCPSCGKRVEVRND